MPLYDNRSLNELTAQHRAWEKHALHKALARFPERYPEFSTVSGLPIDRVYTPSEVADADYARDLGLPGEFPFTRGVHATGHRGRLWTMRMFAGFGTAEETNQRFKYLLKQGQTGLSIAFDMPTLYGYDTDAPEAEGEFGLCGVACSSLADMQVLLDGLPLDAVTTSMTINSPAAIIWAMYIAAAEKRGVGRAKLGGTLQNDILKEYIAQKEFIFPPRPSMRLVTDTVEFAARQMPLWNPISVSGYHIREAGSTAAQELAFTLADGFEYVRWALARGLQIDEFAPRISFFFNAHNDFFEEIAKYRAARRIWAREMRETFGARDPRSWMLRFHTQTAGVSLTAQQPLNNVARVALQALAAVLGGTQSLHTNSLDEALALPGEEAVTVALRTQQIIAHESGVTNTVDPLGGSFFVEALTDTMERQARAYFQQIDAHGGVLPAIEEGFLQREITEAAVRFQREVERGRRVIVGVTDYVSGEQPPTPLLKMDADGYRRQVARLAEVRRTRDNRAVSQRLAELARAARREDGNLMAPILAAVNEYATLQEMMDVLRETWGVYEEPVILQMDAFLSFHASGFWLVIALLAGVVILGVRAYLPPAARQWSIIGYWGLLPYLALITGGVSPRLMGVMYIDWRASLTLGVGLALAMVALASVARISLLSGRRAAHDAPPSLGWGMLALSVGVSGIEEWFWCFLRGAVEETFLLMQFSLDVPAYWSIWIAAALASPFSLLHQPTAYHRLVKAAILVMTSILFFYTRNFWLCWAIHAITWLLLAQPTVATAFTGFTGKSQAQ